MHPSVSTFVDVTDFIKQLNKIKKKYPNSLILHNGNTTPEFLNKLVLGFIKIDIPLEEIPMKAITLESYESLLDVHDYRPVIFLG